MYLNSPFHLPSSDFSSDVGAMMSDASGQMAKTHLQRQISSTSSISGRGVSRVSKPASAGNSPQRLSRRRATTQTVPRQRSSLYQQCLQIPRASNVSHRPVSWHPSTMVGSRQQQPCLDYSVPYQSSHIPCGNSSFYDLSTPSSQNDADFDGVSSSWQYQSSLASLYEPSRDYHVRGPGNPDFSNADAGYFDQFYQMYTSPLEQASEGCPVFSPVPYPPSAWTNSLSTFSDQTSPATPDLIPYPESLPSSQGNSQGESKLPKTDSKELVGMGLHDGPDRNSWSLDSMLGEPTGLFSTHRPDSMGKGLKLEETWEPPEDEDDSDSEDTDEERVQTTRDAQHSGDDEILRFAESALGLGSMDVGQPHPSVNTPNRLLYTGSTPFGTSDMWQGEIADYCVR